MYLCGISVRKIASVTGKPGWMRLLYSTRRIREEHRSIQSTTSEKIQDEACHFSF